MRAMSRALVVSSLLLTFTWAFPFPREVRADFRVFEENAPGEHEEVPEEEEEDGEGPEEEAPEEHRDGIGADADHGETVQVARTPDAGTPAEGAEGTATETPTEGTATDTDATEATSEETATDTAELPPPPAATETEAAPSGDLVADLLDDHRWLDFTGFLQPGLIVRLDNANEGIGSGITDDTFWLQRARIGFRAQLFSWLRARLEIEFAPVTLLQDAFVDVVLHEAATIRVGQMIVPFLSTFRFNELNIAFLDRAIYTPQRPDREYIRFLSPRDVGISVFGRIGNADPASHDPVFEYALGLFIGRGPNIALNDDGVFLWAARMQLHILGVPEGVDRESDLDRNDHARVSVAAGAYSNCDDRSNWNRGFTFDLEARYEGFYASGAFVWTRNSGGGAALLSDSPGCAGQPSGMTNPDGTPIALDFVGRGAHLQAQYVLPPLFQDAFGAPFDAMTFELLARIDWVDANSPYIGSDPLFGGGPGSPGYNSPSNYTNSDDPPTRWRLTFGLNYYPTGEPRFRLGINYQLNREAEDVVTGSGRFSGVSNDIFWLQATVGL